MLLRPTSCFQFFLFLYTIVSLANAATKPNIVLIIADDQDVRTGTLDYMPKLQAAIAQQGITFDRFYAPVSQCCPSRVSLLTAQYAHNHNVTYVEPPEGGYGVFVEKGHNEAYLPIFLQDAGYATYYVGKLMNYMLPLNLIINPAKGWTDNDLLVDPFMYLYNNPAFCANGGLTIIHENEYQTDIITDKATDMLKDAIQNADNTPFFIGIAPTTPHMQVQLNQSFTEPIPPTKYADLFPDAVVPRRDSYNVQGGVSWVKDLPELNQTVLDWIDHIYRQRLRVLQAMDDVVDSVVQQIEDAGIANNTFIFYVGDNGYGLASHRRQPSKTLPFEEDALIPFMVRGPGVPQNVTNSVDVYTMPDLGATILSLAGASATYDIDGREISFTQSVDTSNSSVLPRHSLMEYWNLGAFEGVWSNDEKFENTTYRSLRIIEDDNQWIYGVWCTGERELYNMVDDPYQINNLAVNGDSSAFDFGSYTTLATRLDALLIVLKRCVGVDCREPWAAMFPSGEVTSLAEALNPEYDVYFEDFPKFQYEYCAIGFLAELESPNWTPSLAYHETTHSSTSNTTTADN